MLGRRHSKTIILLTNVDQTSLETDFSIKICRQMAIENTVSGDFCSAFAFDWRPHVVSMDRQISQRRDRKGSSQKSKGVYTVVQRLFII